MNVESSDASRTDFDEAQTNLSYWRTLDRPGYFSNEALQTFAQRRYRRVGIGLFEVLFRNFVSFGNLLRDFRELNALRSHRTPRDTKET
jgi:hypothetical protein